MSGLGIITGRARPVVPSNLAGAMRRRIGDGSRGLRSATQNNIVRIDGQITERPNQRSQARHYDRLEKRLIPRHELTPLREQAMSEIPPLTGHVVDMPKSTRLTRCMVRPCVARGFHRAGIQRSCINVSGLCLELFCSGPSWISARVRSHCRTDLNGPVGSPVFACAGKTDPPSLRILSQTSAGNG